LNNIIKANLCLFLIAFSFISINSSFAGGFPSPGLPIAETDSNNYQLYSFYDLRNRESYVQVTSPDSAAILHVQVFNVGNLCNENNFFDSYTANDTHVYNLRDIQTNDTDPSGFVLPDNAYGFVIITAVQGEGLPANTAGNIIGNFRVIDTTGYEYRTNSQGPSQVTFAVNESGEYTFNFNSLGGVVASDVVGIIANNITSGEVSISQDSIISFDTTLFNNNEVEFSCSDTVFSCTADTFEYGINDAIPNSRDGGVVCGSNVITEGLVRLDLQFDTSIDSFAGYIGLNNGNGRGSMDSFHQEQGLLSCEDRGSCRVFVTSESYFGDFGGIDFADSECQRLADLEGLPGNFKAWVSTTSPSVNPDSRFNQASVPYRLVSGNTIANNYTDLIDGNLTAPINLDETGFFVDSNVWTATTQAGGSFGTNCSNWTDLNEDGGFGNTTLMDFGWTSASFDACDTPDFRLYCFEQ